MFNINIHCKTRHQAELLLQYLEKQGFIWADNISLLNERDEWEHYEERTCYYIRVNCKKVEYQSIENAKDGNEPIVEFEAIATQVARGY